MISAAREIAARTNGASHEVSKSLASPATTFHPSSPGSYTGSPGFSRTPVNIASHPKQLMSFATEDIKILLLENVNKTGRDALEKQGYQVEFYKSSLPEDELIAKIK
jgi:D-3-phosphoglycerate dehydrogenase / 2-oxoglutarate reductase